MVEIRTGDETAGARIVVIGVGGAGNNAVNRMVEEDVTGVEFVAVNTDQQALEVNKAPAHIRIGEKTTKGLGAGANPELGRQAAEESIEELTSSIKGADMVIVTAGMGGGTGTGAAPVIAKIAKDMEILTLAVVTTPFKMEAKKRMNNAMEGINKLKEVVDTLIVIPNEKIIELIDRRVSMVDGFKLADDVLQQAVQGITDLINVNAFINLDFADVQTVMKGKGIAHIGIGRGRGDDKALEAVKQAVESPLLETSIAGATDIIYNITGSLGMMDVNDIGNFILGITGDDVNVIFGATQDDSMVDELVVTVIATGISEGGAAASSAGQGLGLESSLFAARPAAARNPVPGLTRPLPTPNPAAGQPQVRPNQAAPAAGAAAPVPGQDAPAEAQPAQAPIPSLQLRQPQAPRVTQPTNFTVPDFLKNQ